MPPTRTDATTTDPAAPSEAAAEKPALVNPKEAVRQAAATLQAAVKPDPRIEAQKTTIHAVIEKELEAVETPEAAERVVERIERLAAGQTEQQAAKTVEETPGTAAQGVVQTVTQAPTKKDEVAGALVETAAQVVADTAEAPKVEEAVQEVMGTAPSAPTVTPRAERGRQLLRDAVLRRMKPFQAVDARIFLAINCIPHPTWSDRLATAVALSTTGGWIWMGLVVLWGMSGHRPAWRTLKAMAPSVIGATWIVENPIKAYFKRRRPFIDVVQALVVGKKPGSWSFPSGHTASSFATAWVLATRFPRAAPLFFSLASGVGFSRVYVGAHYPGDVLVGAASGMALSEVLRRLTRVVTGRR